MPVNIFSFATEKAPETAVTLRDLWVLVVIPIVVAVLAPLFLQGVAFVLKRRDKAAADHLTFASLKDEITRIETRNAALRALFDEDLKNGEFERKMREDFRYFVYIAEGEPSHEVFDTKARDFSFLSVDCFNILIEYYDTQSLIQASMTDLRSDLFRELSIPRKLSALQNIVGLFEENSSIYAHCQTALAVQPQARRPNRSA